MTTKQINFAELNKRLCTSLRNDLNTIVPPSSWYEEHEALRSTFETYILTQLTVESMLPTEQRYWHKDGYDNIAACNHPNMRYDATLQFITACRADAAATDAWIRLSVQWDLFNLPDSPF